jgi:hypothetical protein
MTFINGHKNRKGYNGDPHQWHNLEAGDREQRLGATATPRPEFNRDFMMEASEGKLKMIDGKTYH